jgi:hypothetical protein
MIQTERHVQLRMVVNRSCPNASTPSRPSDSSKLGPWSCYHTPTALAYGIQVLKKRCLSMLCNTFRGDSVLQQHWQQHHHLSHAYALAARCRFLRPGMCKPQTQLWARFGTSTMKTTRSVITAVLTVGDKVNKETRPK